MSKKSDALATTAGAGAAILAASALLYFGGTAKDPGLPDTRPRVHVETQTATAQKPQPLAAERRRPLEIQKPDIGLAAERRGPLEIQKPDIGPSAITLQLDRRTVTADSAVTSVAPLSVGARLLAAAAPQQPQLPGTALTVVAPGRSPLASDRLAAYAQARHHELVEMFADVEGFWADDTATIAHLSGFRVDGGPADISAPEWVPLADLPSQTPTGNRLSFNAESTDIPLPFTLVLPDTTAQVSGQPELRLPDTPAAATLPEPSLSPATSLPPAAVVTPYLPQYAAGAQVSRARLPSPESVVDDLYLRFLSLDPYAATPQQLADTWGGRREPRAFPRWILAMNAYGWGGPQQADRVAKLQYPVQTIRVSRRDRNVAQTIQLLDGLQGPALLIADRSIMQTAWIDAINRNDVAGIVIGHYYSADPDYYWPAMFLERDVIGLAQSLRHLTDAPLLLATPINEFITHRRGTYWTRDIIAGHLDLFDGFAFFHLISFAALETVDLRELRGEFGLGDKPVILLDTVGFLRGDSRARAAWNNKRSSFFAKMRDEGWSGAVFIGMSDEDTALKDELFRQLPLSQQYSP